VSSTFESLNALSRSKDRASTHPALSVVMPVYNEAEGIAKVVTSWLETFERLDIDYELLVYDDGSRDATGQILLELGAQWPRLVVTRQPNAGHGPTIVRGYREARGEWVFQVDSDDELTPEHFGDLWARRGEFDLLVGCRQNRQAPIVRRMISAVSRATVWTLFGRRLTDVNAPYRLVRRTALTAMIARIPADTFAPNLVMSGLAARDGLRVHEAWAPHRGRRTGTVSIARWRLWKSAARAFRQTVAIALRERGRRSC
jgi:dolichol-phosphate mannosyltransferase